MNGTGAEAGATKYGPTTTKKWIVSGLDTQQAWSGRQNKIQSKLIPEFQILVMVYYLPSTPTFDNGPRIPICWFSVFLLNGRWNAREVPPHRDDDSLIKSPPTEMLGGGGEVKINFRVYPLRVPFIITTAMSYLIEMLVANGRELASVFRVHIKNMIHVIPPGPTCNLDTRLLAAACLGSGDAASVRI
ncbi:hypothetical protein C8R44DRAFT_728216 [Mycena epipterygia]|nr:hypothetical protein C8R44DRAFT_728216 [Mycena epipterygia]